MSNYYYYSDDYQCLLMQILAHSNESFTKIISIDELEKDFDESLRNNKILSYFEGFSKDKTLVITNFNSITNKPMMQVLLITLLNKRLSVGCDTFNTYIFSSDHPNYISNNALKNLVLNNFKSIYLIDGN